MRYKSVQKETWQMKLFAEDVNYQAGSKHIMKRLLTVCTEWVHEYGMVWKLKKCTIIRKKEEIHSPRLEIDGKSVNTNTRVEWLAVTAIEEEAAPDTTARRI